VLPVILALWSPDFPHAGPFGALRAAERTGRGFIVLQKGKIVKQIAKDGANGYNVEKA